jgi:hypothetical protein
VLTINHGVYACDTFHSIASWAVFDILSHYVAHRDWKAAFVSIIPQRKVH